MQILSFVGNLLKYTSIEQRRIFVFLSTFSRFFPFSFAKRINELLPQQIKSFRNYFRNSHLINVL